MRLWNVLNGLNSNINYGKIPFNNIVDKTNLQLSVTEFEENNFVFVPGTRNVCVYNIYNGSLYKTLKGHFDVINCCLYNPNLNEMYSGSKDKNILVWLPKIQEHKDDDDDRSARKRPLEDYMLPKSSKQRNSNTSNNYINSWSDNEGD